MVKHMTTEARTRRNRGVEENHPRDQSRAQQLAGADLIDGALRAAHRQGAGSNDKLVRVFDTIEERAHHLGTFLEGYASFARIPKPRAEEVSWGRFLDGIRALWPTWRLVPRPSRLAISIPRRCSRCSSTC